MPPSDPFDQSERVGDTAWRLGLALLLALATWAGFSGSGSTLPLDAHEVFVARTGEEMLERHELMLPYLNDVPRFKKPPMNYWLAILANRVGGTGDVITEFEARLPSIIGGIGLVALTVTIGAILFGRAIGLLAGLLLTASSGYVFYTHSARPEMLYAFFCTGGLLGWLLSEQTYQGKTESAAGKARWFARLGWASMGLAMLTKGPQLPGILLAGFLVYLVWTGRRREITPILRPFSGLLIFIAVSAWWYAIAYRAGAAAIWQEEAARRANAGQRHWGQWFTPYYLLRTPALLLPWVAFFVLALIGPWLGRLRGNRAAKLCWSLMVVAMLLLSLAWGRRWYYMLPAIAPVFVLLAVAAVEAGRMFTSKRWGRFVWGLFLAAHAAGVLALAFIEWRSVAPALAPPLWGLIVMAALAVITVVLLPRLARRTDWPVSSVALVAALVGVCFPIMAMHGSMWSEVRLTRRDFALMVNQHVGHDEALFGYTDTWQIEAYYSHRAILTVTTADAVARTVVDHGHAWLLISDDVSQKFKLPDSLQAETVLSGFDRAEGGDAPERVSLLRLTPAPATAATSQPARDGP